MVRRIRIKLAVSADFDGVIIAKRRQFFEKSLVSPYRKLNLFKAEIPGG
jgi:hypothetical protein